MFCWSGARARAVPVAAALPLYPFDPRRTGGLSRKWRVSLLEFGAVDQIMNDSFDFYRKLFGTKAWPAPGHCGFNEVLRQVSLYWLRLNRSSPVAEAP